MGLVDIFQFPAQTPANTHTCKREEAVYFSHMSLCVLNAYFWRTQMAFTLRCEMLGRYYKGPFRTRRSLRWDEALRLNGVWRGKIKTWSSQFLSQGSNKHTHPSTVCHNLPPYEWRWWCRSPELSPSFNSERLSSSYCFFSLGAYLSANNRRMNVLIELRV